MPHSPQDPTRATIGLMPSIPTILLILSLPVGAVAYVTAARILGELPLPEGLKGFLVLFAPLFVAGLVMMPFLIPFFDRKAKADLAEYRRDDGIERRRRRHRRRQRRRRRRQRPPKDRPV